MGVVCTRGNRSTLIYQHSHPDLQKQQNGDTHGSNLSGRVYSRYLSVSEHLAAGVLQLCNAGPVPDELEQLQNTSYRRGVMYCHSRHVRERASPEGEVPDSGGGRKEGEERRKGRRREGGSIVFRASFFLLPAVKNRLHGISKGPTGALGSVSEATVSNPANPPMSPIQT